MSKLTYWEERQIEDMFGYMEKAELAADEISKLYKKASRYLSLKSDEIFEKYQTKHGLSEREARALINTLQDKTSLEELLQKLKNSESKKEKQELIKQLEAPAYQARLERLQQLQNQIDILMRNVYQQEKDFSTRHYVDLANEVYYKSIFRLQQRAEAAFSFNYLSAKQVDRAINSRWSGEHYSKRIWKNTQSLAQDLKEELLVNLVTGRTNREAARIISNKFAQGSSVARRLVRTESNFVSTELNFIAYKEVGIEEYQYLATLDLKTSQICRKLDGQIFLVKERKVGINCPPMHPWCRSTTVSVVDREWLEDMRRSALDPSTGQKIKVPRTMNYAQWYEKYVKGKPQAESEEKKIKNRSTDARQHKEYQKVLGKSIPDKLDGFQDLKYNEPERWKFTKLDYQRRHKLMEHPELKLPNAENATAPDKKFTHYLFDGEHQEGLAKGAAFASRLGYDINNWQKLQNEIIKSATKYPATHKGNNGYGDRYEQKIILQGKKNTPANVVVGWMHKTDGTLSMSSAYIKEVN